jgi:hypothetical protein
MTARLTAMSSPFRVALLSQHAIDGRTADAEGRRYRARTLTAGMHALRQSGFGGIQRLRTTNSLAAYTSSLPRR